MTLPTQPRWFVYFYRVNPTSLHRYKTWLEVYADTAEEAKESAAVWAAQYNVLGYEFDSIEVAS